MTSDDFKREALQLRPTLMLTAKRYLRDGAAAEDMVQDALLRLWQMVGELQVPMERFAVKVVRNLCISKLRQQKSTVDIEMLPVGETAVAEEDDERMERIMSIVDQLPSGQQLILRLRHIDGMHSADIASLMGNSDAAVRKSLSRARQAVRDRYFNNRKEKETI